jgi:hypothetical protein
MKQLPAHRWQVTIDGVHKGPVTDHKVGVQGAAAWSKWEFAVDGAGHELRAERDTGGSTTITLDGAATQDASLDIHPTTHGLAAVLVVKCHFTVGSIHHEYRFDGRMWP